MSSHYCMVKMLRGHFNESEERALLKKKRPNNLSRQNTLMGKITEHYFCPMQIQSEPRFTYTHLIRTPRYYFALSLGKESPYIFSKLNPFKTDTR